MKGACYARGTLRFSPCGRAEEVGILSRERTRGEFPPTPDIGSLQFEDLRSLRNRMPAKCGCYTI